MKSEVYPRIEGKKAYRALTLVQKDLDIITPFI